MASKDSPDKDQAKNHQMTHQELLSVQNHQEDLQMLLMVMINLLRDVT